MGLPLAGTATRFIGCNDQCSRAQPSRVVSGATSMNPERMTLPTRLLIFDLMRLSQSDSEASLFPALVGVVGFIFRVRIGIRFRETGFDSDMVAIHFLAQPGYRGLVLGRNIFSFADGVF